MDPVSSAAPPAAGGVGRVDRADAIRHMTAVWEEVLKTDEIEPDDSFFTLGGQSLMAAAMVNAVGERFGVQIPIRGLFEHSRLADFTEHVLGLAAPADPRPATALADADLAMTAFQRRIWLAELIDPDVRNHVPLAWQVTGGVDPDRLREALCALVAEHEILRTGFVEDDDELLVQLRQPWRPRLELLDLHDSPDGVAEWLDTAVRQPFDLEEGHLLRAALADLGDGRQALLLCVHHVVIDGESIAVLLHDLDRHYSTPYGARSIVQYREFAAYQERQRDTDAWRADLRYWESALRGAPPNSSLPAPEHPEPNGAFRVPLPVGLNESLLTLQTEHGVSWFMVAATALAVTLHRWTGLDDVTIGSPMVNRPEPRFARLLGPCLNTAVLRSRASAETTLRDALIQMRDQALGALEHQSVEFDDVVNTVKPTRRFGYTPYTDVTLNMNLLDDHAGMIGDAKLTPILDDSLRSTYAKFTLTVTMAQREGSLIALVAHRGDQLSADHARRLTDDLADLLTRFPQALEERVMREA